MKIKFGKAAGILISVYYLFSFVNCGSRCCFIEMPPVTFTSERTSLENQIIGTYKEIREDVWLVSSSRTVEGLNISSSANTNISKQFTIEYKIIKAVETIEYDKEPVRISKSKGYIGENSRGLLSYRENNYIEDNPNEKQKLFELIDEVNDARAMLMIEVINKNKNLSIDDMDQVKKTFADMYRTEALKGEWIRDDKDQWYRKE